MAETPCPFCLPDASRIFHAGDLVLGLWDGYPVSPGHALLIPRRHIPGWFEATPAERSELAAATDIAREAILRRHQPDGFNIGINVGPAAGTHVEQWTKRLSAPDGSVRRQLAEIAGRAGFDHHSERTMNVARTIYSRLPDDVRLWLRSREFVAVSAERERLLHVLGL